jgi:hypothetical protein
MLGIPLTTLYRKFIKKWLTKEKDTHIRNLIWLML